MDGVCLRRQGDVDKLFDVEVRIAAFLADGTESNRLVGLKNVLRCRVSEGECQIWFAKVVAKSEGKCLLLYVNRSSDYVQSSASGNHSTGDFASVGHENTTDARLAIVVKREWCDEQIRELVHIHVDYAICL